MKKAFILVSMLIVAASTFCQQPNPAPALTKQDYLQKSKNQKKTAWIMLGGGAALVLTGVLIPRGEHTGWNPISGDEYENDGISAAFGLTGMVAMLGSIPFFISSGKNKRKAMSSSVVLKMERLVEIQQYSTINQIYPAVGIQINLR